MPSIQRQLLNPDFSQGENKLEKLVKLIKKVRISYNDPDATDSDSNEEEDDHSGINTNTNVARVKRVIKEIVIVRDASEKPNAENPRFVNNAEKMTTDESKKLQRSSSMYKGVRKRKWGKFAAEIRDPFQRKRIWLGTYDNEEEAAKVYQAKKLEFDSMSEKIKDLGSTGVLAHQVSVHTSSEETNGLFSLPSPSSVLDISPSAPKVEGSGKLAEAKKPIEIVDVDAEVSKPMFDQLILPLLSQDLHPSTEDNLLCCRDVQKQPISELMVEPSDYYNALKEMEALQPFSRDQSVSAVTRKESFLSAENHLPCGRGEGEQQFPTIVMDPPMSPSITPILNFENDPMQYGNDLKHLGLPENLLYVSSKDLLDAVVSVRLDVEKTSIDLETCGTLDFESNPLYGNGLNGQLMAFEENFPFDDISSVLCADLGGDEIWMDESEITVEDNMWVNSIL